MSHDRCQTVKATREREQRALQHVVDEIVRILENAKDIKVQDDPAAGRIFVSIPPPNSAVVMSVKITQGLVTANNLVGGFGEWLPGDTQLLFRAFEEDSLRYKLLGREDQREVVKGGRPRRPRWI
jgi:hypothetical protein